jgi:hypothetical protein
MEKIVIVNPTYANQIVTTQHGECFVKGQSPKKLDMNVAEYAHLLKQNILVEATDTNEYKKPNFISDIPKLKDSLKEVVTSENDIQEVIETLKDN